MAEPVASRGVMGAPTLQPLRRHAFLHCGGVLGGKVDKPVTQYCLHRKIVRDTARGGSHRSSRRRHRRRRRRREAAQAAKAADVADVPRVESVTWGEEEGGTAGRLGTGGGSGDDALAIVGDLNTLSPLDVARFVERRPGEDEASSNKSLLYWTRTAKNTSPPPQVFAAAVPAAASTPTSTVTSSR